MWLTWRTTRVSLLATSMALAGACSAFTDAVSDPPSSPPQDAGEREDGPSTLDASSDAPKVPDANCPKVDPFADDFTRANMADVLGRWSDAEISTNLGSLELVTGGIDGTSLRAKVGASTAGHRHAEMIREIRGLPCALRVGFAIQPEGIIAPGNTASILRLETDDASIAVVLREGNVIVVDDGVKPAATTLRLVPDTVSQFDVAFDLARGTAQLRVVTLGTPTKADVVLASKTGEPKAVRLGIASSSTAIAAAIFDDVKIE